ncbi:phage holin family protein [Pseudoxanthomonas sp.]|uniref:phage holin family protein n=1 Tax=Pseudoxanthomonas sp. TaxID=1871049 RepID=UPI00263957EA|nr:phage holin family protein [Pseudoxanthomonas sp.]WDS37931.1 MAG: phage holin family protein [Pseudoxanthomonas sp.]
MSEADTDRDTRPDPPPSLDQSLRDVGKAGKEGLSSAVSTARALRSLMLADFALARASLARALVWMAVAGVFGVSSWLLLMGALIALLQRLGLSWLAALSVAAAMSLAITVLGVVQTLRYFEHTRMDATRRQLKLMGIGDDEPEVPGGGEATAPQPAPEGSPP